MFGIKTSSHVSPQVMTETLKGTVNETGFEMAMASPLLEHFAAAYDGQHPLLDAGEATGKATVGKTSKSRVDGWKVENGLVSVAS